MTPIKQTKFHTEAENGNCMAAALASLLDLSIEDVPAFEEMQGSWKSEFLSWLDGLGMQVRTVDEAPQGLAIATGLSPRDVHHAVVVENGTFVHDPHPSNDFLRFIEKFWHITPKDSDHA